MQSVPATHDKGGLVAYPPRKVFKTSSSEIVSEAILRLLPNSEQVSLLCYLALALPLTVPLTVHVIIIYSSPCVCCVCIKLTIVDKYSSNNCQPARPSAMPMKGLLAAYSG